MNSKFADYLDNVIYPRLDRSLIFPTLNPFLKGEIIYADCPSCGKRGKAWIKQDGHRLSCWSCNHSVHILAYVAGTEAPRGKEFLVALERLADLAGVPPPEQSLSPTIFKQLKIEARKADAFERILEICRSALNSPWEAEDAREYLEKRNFDIARHPLGWLETSRAFVEEFGADMLVDLGFARREGGETGAKIVYTWHKRIIGPLFDRHGRILGFWGRTLDERNNPPKYRWTTGAKVATVGALGLNDAALAFLILVEGSLDVFKARQHGVYNLAALAGTGASERWDALINDWKVSQAVLLFDNDEPGYKATVAAIESYLKNAKRLTLWVVPPWCMGDCKDPDEYMDKYGGEALLAMVKHNKMSVAEYYAKAVLNGYEWGRKTES